MVFREGFSRKKVQHRMLVAEDFDRLIAGWVDLDRAEP
jgi:hypothetical protein